MASVGCEQDPEPFTGQVTHGRLYTLHGVQRVERCCIPRAMSSNGITDKGLATEMAVAAVLVVLPGLLVLIRWLSQGTPFRSQNVADTRITSASISSLSLTLAGLTFAAISFLSSGDQDLGVSRQTPIGFFMLAFVMYVGSVLPGKWLRQWTLYVQEELRDAGTILLLLGVSFLILDFPGSDLWTVMAVVPAAVAGLFFLLNLDSTLKMLWGTHASFIHSGGAFVLFSARAFSSLPRGSWRLAKSIAHSATFWR